MNAKKILKPIAWVIVSVLVTACAKENASDVNQDKIYTDYEVLYNSNTDVTTVVARFLFGGPTKFGIRLRTLCHFQQRNPCL